MVEHNHPHLITTTFRMISLKCRMKRCSDFILSLALLSINNIIIPFLVNIYHLRFLFLLLKIVIFVLQRTVRLCEQLSTVIPNSHVYYRRGLALKKIIPQCISRDFTDLIVINEDRKTPSILLFFKDSYFAWFLLKISNNKTLVQSRYLGSDLRIL